MESIGQTLRRSEHLQKVNTDALLREILADTAIADFISVHQLTQEEITRSLPKFNQFRNERQKFQTGDRSYIAKGYEPVLVMNEGYADVSYRETAVLKDLQSKQAVANRIHLMNLPKSYKQIRFDDINVDDVKRVAVFEALVNFVATYPKQAKGLYLYGDMGIGKSFLMAAMAHELAAKKAVSVTMLHYPTFVVDVKHAITSGSVKDEIDTVKTAPVLILDDIGAEQSTSWVRDEVLQVILQHRMLEELPTFFTSNYSLEDLEKKLAQVRQGDETWQAKRVLERIRAVATEHHLQGENRR